MFTRIVEMHCKKGQMQELATLIREKVVPILRSQEGFRDEIALVSSEDPNLMLGLSFWDHREAAEQYQRQAYSRVADLLDPFCDGKPTLRTFEVSMSTAHNLPQQKAA
jgi:quinol monooxygenase YgiN